ALDRAHDVGSGLRMPKMLEHQRAGPDRADRIGDLLPAMSGAEPCTGSKMEGAVRSGLIFPEAAMPMVPAVAGPRSERMSPKRFEATMTSKRSGLSTIWMVRPST